MDLSSALPLRKKFSPLYCECLCKCVFQLFWDFTLGLTHGCTDRGTDGPCNNLLPKQARSNKWPKADGTQSNNSPSNKTERKMPKTKLPLLKSQNQPQGYQDILKAWPWKARSVHALGSVSHHKLNHAYRPHGEKYRLTEWLIYKMCACTCAPLQTKQKRFHLTTKANSNSKKERTFEVSMMLLMLKVQNNKVSHINPS